MRKKNTKSFESTSSSRNESQLLTDSEKHFKKLDPDKFIESYGSFGRYQIFTYIIVQTLNFFYSSSMYVMSYVQLKYDKECSYQNETMAISQTCMIENNILFPSLENQKCGEIPGSSLMLKTHTARTNLLIDFNLSCSHFIIQEFGLTFFTLGAVFAVPVMSMLADRYGRRPIIVASAIIAFFANIAAAFSPNYTVFIILRTIVGAASDTYLCIACVLTCEYISEKARSYITVVYNVAWALGMIWTLGVTFLTDNWRWRYFIIVLPGVYAFFLIGFLPESPHWLIIHSKREKLKKYIKTSNKINKMEPNFEECQGERKHEEKHESCSHLCNSPKMLWIIFANGYIQFVISLVYFALSFVSVEVDDDDYKAFLYTSVIEIPAGIVVIPLMTYLDRKQVVFHSSLIQTICLVVITFFLDNYTVKIIFMLIAKAAATIVYSVHPIWANEQFPTSVRSLSFAIMNIPQSIGIIISPYFKHLVMNPAWIPFTVISILSLLSTLITCFLRETRNMKMPTDVESLSTSDFSKVSNISEISVVSKESDEVGLRKTF